MRNKTFYFSNILILFVFSLLFASCDDEKRVDIDKLPTKAQQFISGNFPGISVAQIIQDKDDGRKEYDVILSDGSTMQFDENGDWKEITCPFSTFPPNVLPENITTDLNGRYPQAHILKAEKEIGGYVLEINTAEGAHYELRYSTNGEFISQSVD